MEDGVEDGQVRLEGVETGVGGLLEGCLGGLL
jgi:hypothetical protein